MWDLAVREEDFDEIDAMLARYRGRPPLSMRLLPAAARADTAMLRELIDEGRALESRQLQIAARYAASYLEDFALSDTLVRLDLAWRQRPANRAAAQVLVAGLAAARGRWIAARAGYATAQTMEGAELVAVHRAVAATLPLQPVSREDLVEALRAIERWEPRVADPGADLPAALRPHLRHYLLGLLASRLDDMEGAERAARAIENLPIPPAGDAVVRGLAATVRADQAWKQNRPRDVLRTLESVDHRIPLELIAVSRAAHLREYGLEHARYLRAVALSALGRDAEALAWLRFGLRGSPQEYLYQAPVHLALGELFARMGQADSSRAHYRGFLTLWSDADPGAAPVLESVRSRLTHR